MHPETGLRDARILCNPDPAGQASLRDSVLDLPKDSNDLRRYEQQTRKWTCINTFFEIDYFYLTWIVQELGVAWEALLYTAPRPGNKEAGSKTTASTVELGSIAWPLVGRFVEFMDDHGASLVTHLGLPLWVAHHT